LVHVGLILLLVGELLSGLWQRDRHVRLDEGQTRNYAESFRENELAIIDVTDAQFDEVVAIRESLLANKATIAHPKLPFRIVTKAFYPNSSLHVRPEHGAATLATAGLGQRVLAAPQPLTFKQDERNLPSAFVELIGAEGSLGVYLVSLQLAVPQEFDFAGRKWRIALRPERQYFPFDLTLHDFTHERYPGTEIPKNFSSRVRLQHREQGEDREVLIFMNNPLRYGGLTFYQAGFENNDRTTVLQVVENPSWLMPYVACTTMALGLVLQFGIHLVTFAHRRRNVAAVGTGTRGAALGGRARQLSTALLILATAVIVAPTFRAPRNDGSFDVQGFSRLPVLVNGRVKPLDTVARTSLLVMQGRQRVSDSAGRTIAPAEWLADVLFRPEQADAYQVFEVTHPDVLTLMAVATSDGSGGKRFSQQQLRPRLRDLDAQAKLAQTTAAELRTPFQRGVIKLRDAVMLYQRLQSTVNALGMPDFFDRLTTVNSRDSSALSGGTADFGAAFRVMDSLAYLHVVPPSDPQRAPNDWKTMGAAWSEALGSGRPDAAALKWAVLGKAWRARDPGMFNRAVAESVAEADDALPATMSRVRVEARFNAAQPFYTSLALYVGAFLLAVFSWLKWPHVLRRGAMILVTTAFVVTTIGIVTRMWLENRPPVTNLYSSALFVGWGAVALCLVLEISFRNAIAAASAGLIGFATLLIAHHLSMGGDTLEMMRAVLDSNFWLATHVVTVTVGYAATFLAGFLGLIYVGRGFFTRSLDAATADSLARMMYGIVCFATLFSFVGTVLGGIWADQSWGRFWGWDPKENGALLIVVWNAVILHARWGGLVRQRGLAALAIFGNVVTAWSWFGVNMLGIGLHSYGFMDAAFWWLVGFAISQLALIAVASVPLQNWRSFRSPQSSAMPAGSNSAKALA
jgi:ABC-type transport system involved in cytochrome c biogenesis permease subunit